MDKYEISLWEDYINENSRFEERKLCVIGSDTMTGPVRALEPKLVENVNGTNTFTFKMYYTYTDSQTGEKYPNPFSSLLINERKIKVFWKDKWYDLVIKNCKEDSSGKSIIYTCNDLYINELSKNGFSLEFDTELENNIGTAQELSNAILEDTDWSVSPDSEQIIQKIEEPVYDIHVLRPFLATNFDGKEILIPQDGAVNENILIYYSIVADPNNPKSECQFLYSADGWETDVNDMLVLNGTQYTVNINWTYEDGILIAQNSEGIIFVIDYTKGTSSNYRAERIVKSVKTITDTALNRTVNLYTYTQSGITQTIRGYEETVYETPDAVVNLIANPNSFTTTEGWIGSGFTYGVFPKMVKDVDLPDYMSKAKSYLKITAGAKDNIGLSANKQYLEDGIRLGEKFIFRVKAYVNLANQPGNPVEDISAFNIQIKDKNGQNYLEKISGFLEDGISYPRYNDGWLEYAFVVTNSILFDDISYSTLQIIPKSGYWLSDVELFRFCLGYIDYESKNPVRMNPGQIELHSFARTKYNYYPNISYDKKENIEYIWSDFIPLLGAELQYTNEKIRSINGKESNRFNLLQDIAETFECWIKFIIEHDKTGKIIVDEDGTPHKYIKIVKEVGEETGLAFEYGIDLKTISRTIKSDQIATKVIVRPNEDEFATNGFCSIARSKENYPKENFILNMDYYLNQGLLNREQYNKDLYSWDGSNLGYYYHLHDYNGRYDKCSEIITQKELELLHQESLLEIYNGYLSAAEQEKTKLESDLKILAGVTGWDAAVDYIKGHATDSKIQSLVNAHLNVVTSINTYAGMKVGLEQSIEAIQNEIQNQSLLRDEYKELIEELHYAFYKKYSRYIQEGTWDSKNYIDDDLYYLDALSVAYTSSRPQISYDINVLRLSSLDEYSSKIFNLGDICYIVDRDFFGYKEDGITPYKEKVIVGELTSNFDSPEKDIIKIQNYKTQFDDLFQRITATTQSLQYASGSYARAAGIINPDGTLKVDNLQATLDENGNLVYQTANQGIILDGTGITLSDTLDGAKKTKITSNGLQVSNDGGNTWQSAIGADGINTALLTADTVNTDKIVIGNADMPSFRWDNSGLNAYVYTNTNKDYSSVDTQQFVRFDQYGIYGMKFPSINDNFTPTGKTPKEREDSIFNSPFSQFGMTWNRFFMKNATQGGGFIEISTDNDIIIKDNASELVQPRIQIGRLDGQSNYGIVIRDSQYNDVFKSDSSGASIAGWNLNASQIYYGNNNTGVYMNSDGTFVCKVNGTIRWSLDNGGTGTFHYIEADGGHIAGWRITNGGFYNDDGTSLTCGGTYNITTNKLYCTGGSVGGCSVGAGSISGAGWSLSGSGCSIPISSLTAGGVTMNPSWTDISYVTSLPSLSVTSNYAIANGWATTGNEKTGYSTYVTSYEYVNICHGWWPGSTYHKETTTVLKGTSSGSDINP